MHRAVYSAHTRQGELWATIGDGIGSTMQYPAQGSISMPQQDRAVVNAQVVIPLDEWNAFVGDPTTLSGLLSVQADDLAGRGKVGLPDNSSCLLL